MKLEQLRLNIKLTENGDLAFKNLNDTLLDIFFKSAYYEKHLDELPKIGDVFKSQVFSMFMRDPRFGMGRRDLGRALMKEANVGFENMVLAGRYDDIWQNYKDDDSVMELLSLWLKDRINQGDELCKKWMPRYSSKNVLIARKFAKLFGMNKQQYGHFIKCTTVESNLSQHHEDDIDFEHIPSLAMLKYFKTFSNKEIFAKRFEQYLEDVKSGKKQLNVKVTTPYDIYKNREKLGDDCDTFFDKLPLIHGNWIPIVDTSGSMFDDCDSIGKALAIGHYLAKGSTYAPNRVVSFSSTPSILSLDEDNEYNRSRWRGIDTEKQDTSDLSSKYLKEIARMNTGDCSNTDFGAVMNLLKNLGKDAPEYLVVLSDMEFDQGSKHSKEDTMNYFKEIGVSTKIIWWNFNSRAMTCPETDEYGNIFISGYNPTLLKYLEAGFDAQKFLDKLLEEYKNNLMLTLVAYIKRVRLVLHFSGFLGPDSLWKSYCKILY